MVVIKKRSDDSLTFFLVKIVTRKLGPPQLNVSTTEDDDGSQENTKLCKLIVVIDSLAGLPIQSFRRGRCSCVKEITVKCAFGLKLTGLTISSRPRNIFISFVSFKPINQHYYSARNMLATDSRPDSSSSAR